MDMGRESMDMGKGIMDKKRKTKRIAPEKKNKR